jgi:hypothetical protein
MKERTRVMHGFGDASGTGFGSTISMSNGDIVWKRGVWSRTMVEGHNSIFFELANLVHALEDLHKAGKLDGQEILMCMDNTTAEAAHYGGTTKNGKRLFDLVLRLRRIEREGQCKIVLVHVAGRRMIWQGSDGLSRGDENAGVISGEEMMSLVPLHKAGVDRSENLLSWVWSWCGNETAREKVSLLQPEDWASPHVEGGTYVWSPRSRPRLLWNGWASPCINGRTTRTFSYPLSDEVVVEKVLIPRDCSQSGNASVRRTPTVNILLD